MKNEDEWEYDWYMKWNEDKIVDGMIFLMVKMGGLKMDIVDDRYDGWKMKIYSPSIMPTHYCYTPTSPNWWHLSPYITIHLFHPNCTHGQ